MCETWVVVEKKAAATIKENQIFVSKTQNLPTFLLKTYKKLIKTNKKEDLCPLSLSGLSELHSSVALNLALLALNVLNLCKSSGNESLYYYRSLL